MEVPIYNESVPVETTGLPTPQAADITPAASGVNIAEAQARLGQTVERTASSIGHQVNYVRRLEAQEDAYDRVSKYATKMDTALNGDGGLLTRQGKDADGILHGNDPNGIGKGSYLDLEAQARNEATAGLGLYEKRSVERGLDRVHNSNFNAVTKHEAREKQVARQQSADDHVATLGVAAENATNAKDLSGLIHQGVEAQLALNPGIDQEHHDLLYQKVAAQIMEPFVRTQSEKNPEVARDVLQQITDQYKTGNMQPILHPDDAAKFKAHVEGKWVDMRQESVAAEALDQKLHPENFINGMPNVDAIRDFAMKASSTRDPGEQFQIANWAVGRARDKISAQYAQRQGNRQGLLDFIADSYDKNVPVEQVIDHLKKNPVDLTGYPHHDQETAIGDAHKVYQSQDSLAVRDSHVQDAVDQSKKMAESHFSKNQSDEKDRFGKEIEERAIKLRDKDPIIWADKIRKDTTERLKDIQVGTTSVLSNLLEGKMPTFAHTVPAFKKEWQDQAAADEAHVKAQSDLALRASVAQRFRDQMKREPTQAEIDSGISWINQTKKP